MPRSTVGDDNGTPVELYSEDFGSGDPVLIHGWPTDFRDDLKAFAGVPTLVIHGDPDAPHGLNVTYAATFNAEPPALLRS